MRIERIDPDVPEGAIEVFQEVISQFLGDNPQALIHEHFRDYEYTALTENHHYHHCHDPEAWRIKVYLHCAYNEETNEMRFSLNARLFRDSSRDFERHGLGRLCGMITVEIPHTEEDIRINMRRELEEASLTKLETDERIAFLHRALETPDSYPTAWGHITRPEAEEEA